LAQGIRLLNSTLIFTGLCCTMGVTPEQKLVVKHTFLEYEKDEAPANCEPLRQRSWTAPIEEPYYAEVGDEDTHDSDTSASSDSGDDAEEIDQPCMISTPEMSPLHGPSYRHMTLPGQHESSWQETASSDGGNGYITWPPPCSEQCMDGSWWTPVAYDVNTGLPINYCDAVDPNQFQAQCSTTVRSSVLTPIAENDGEASFPQVPNCNEAVQSGNVNGPAPKETRSTVMLRGLPETYTRSNMIKLLASEGFFGRFNFVYLPVDFKRCQNLGYALINMVSATEALRLRKRFEGFSNWDVAGGSVCVAAWCSPQQGLQAHVERYRNSPVMHESVPDEWRPMLLSHGVQIAFPPPTIKLKAPRWKGAQ